MKKIKYILVFIIIFLVGCDMQSYHIHTFEKGWSSDEVNHFHKSTCEHNLESKKEKHQFDEGITINEETVLYTCIVCGYEKQVISHVHTYEEGWSSDEVNHFHKSTCEHDLTTDNEPHLFESTIIKIMSITSPEIIRHTCKICNYY